MIEIASQLPWWSYLLFGLVIAIFIPKGFMLIGPRVRDAQRTYRIHESVLSGLAYKYDRTRRGFGEKEEYMYWTERMADGQLRVWCAWAKQGVMYKIVLTNKIDESGIKKSGSSASDNFQN